MTFSICYGDAIHMDDMETSIVKTWCSVQRLLTAQSKFCRSEAQLEDTEVVMSQAMSD